MKQMKFRVRLKMFHDKSGITQYRVAKDTKLAINTVRKYVLHDEVLVDTLPTAVLELSKYYGADWRDPAVIDIVVVDK